MRRRGFTLVEMLAAVALAALLGAALYRALSFGLQVEAERRASQRQQQDLVFALDRIERLVTASPRLLIPQPERATTSHQESTRDPGVIALVLPGDIDLDRNGIADADNDGDGAVNEDPSGDLTADGAPGVLGLDDDNDGAVDEAHAGAGADGEDDDEDGSANEDGWTDSDDDGDFVRGEDPRSDSNHDSAPGRAGVDDDGDLLFDEGNTSDDDEDGSADEDWIDVVTYRLDGERLLERYPTPGGGPLAAVERELLDGVSLFRVRRTDPLGGAGTLLVVELSVTSASGSTASRYRIFRIQAHGW